MVTLGDNPRPGFAAILGILGLIGSFFIIRLGRAEIGVEEATPTESRP